MSRTGALWICCRAALITSALSTLSGAEVVLQADSALQTEKKLDGFSVRKEPAKFNDALEDFGRYRDKKAWAT